MPPPRKCSCGWCKLCMRREAERDRMRDYMREYRRRRKLERLAVQNGPVLRDERRAVKLTREQRELLRRAIDERVRARLQEFAR